MLIPSKQGYKLFSQTSLSRRVNANSQLHQRRNAGIDKLIKKGEC